MVVNWIYQEQDQDLMFLYSMFMKDNDAVLERMTAR